MKKSTTSDFIGDVLDSKPAKPAAQAPKGEGKKRLISPRIDAGLWERLRNAQYWLSGPPHRATITSIAEAGLERELKRLEKAENGGKPFAPREGEAKVGCPPRSR